MKDSEVEWPRGRLPQAGPIRVLKVTWRLQTEQIIWYHIYLLRTEHLSYIILLTSSLQTIRCTRLRRLRATNAMRFSGRGEYRKYWLERVSPRDGCHRHHCEKSPSLQLIRGIRLHSTLTFVYLMTIAYLHSNISRPAGVHGSCESCFPWCILKPKIPHNLVRNYWGIQTCIEHPCPPDRGDLCLQHSCLIPSSRDRRALRVLAPDRGIWAMCCPSGSRQTSLCRKEWSEQEASQQASNGQTM